MCFESYTWKYEKHDEFNLKLEQSIYNAQRHYKKKKDLCSFTIKMQFCLKSG